MSEPQFLQQLVTADELAKLELQFEKEAIEAMSNRKHYFMATVCYRVSDNAVREAVSSGFDPLLMDRENLRMMAIGCYICEKPYNRRMATRPCDGDPKGRTRQ